MDSKALQLRENVILTKEHAKRLQRELDQLERMCQHNWSEPVYDPHYQEAYTIPGDKLGTMGVHVSAKTTPRWMQTCGKCGKIQATEKKKMAFSGREEVPDFG